MSEGYKVDEEEQYIIYYNVNNLYGWAMTESLPYGGFEWAKNVNKTNFFNIPDDCNFGYFVEVDLKYSETLHDAHKDLPFCAEHIVPPGSKQKKLMRRFTSTAPARGAQAPNRAISNSCL